MEDFVNQPCQTGPCGPWSGTWDRPPARGRVAGAGLALTLHAKEHVLN